MPVKKPVRKRGALFRWAIAGSIIAHLLLLAALVYIPYRIYYSNAPEEKTASRATPTGGGAPAHTTPVPAGAIGPELRTPEEQMDLEFQDRVREAIEDARKTPAANRVADLKATGDQLTAISSDESVDEIAAKFKQMNKTPDRATQPADKPVDGPFDFDTAQIHDVARSGDAQSGYKYQATLLDAAGRTHAVEMSADEGEPIYETMQMVKQNPFMEKIYRQIMLPMLDQMVAEESKQAVDAPPAAAPAQ